MAETTATGPANADEPTTIRLTEESFHEEFHEVGSGAIYVWELPVRLTHWAIVISIVVLTVTGLYIHMPFFSAPTVAEGAAMTANIRFIHELSAIVFTVSFAIRFYWGFVGNSFASWRAIIPHNRAQLYWGREMARYYLFLRKEPVPVTGHNFLAGAAYTVVSILMVFQVMTGLLLMAWVVGTGPLAILLPIATGFPGGIQSVRLLHYLLTFLFVAFAIHHVYSAILVDTEERSGVLSSIFSGYKNLKPGRTIEALGVAGRPAAPEEARRLNGE
jgi:Ni/Fe-hydrogenase 1 B-type cytochrome subunit